MKSQKCQKHVSFSFLLSALGWLGILSGKLIEEVVCLGSPIGLK
jgi:hypothetical protein